MRRLEETLRSARWLCYWVCQGGGDLNRHIRANAGEWEGDSLDPPRLFRSRNHWRIWNAAGAGSAINKGLDERSALRELISVATRVTDSSNGAAGILTERGIVFDEYYEPASEEKWLTLALPPFQKGYGIPGHVMERRVAYVSQDARNDPRVIAGIREQLRFTRLIDVPILITEEGKDELLGCLEMHKREGSQPYNLEDLAILTILASDAATSIRNAQTHRKDILVPCQNRLAAKEVLDRLYALPPTARREHAALFLDLDGFKQVNDHHGHEYGDRILCAATERVKRNVRGRDVVTARMGGDEFLVVLDGCTLADGYRVARKITDAFEHEPLVASNGKSVILGVSIGVASTLEANTAEELITLGDQRMYMVKETRKSIRE